MPDAGGRRMLSISTTTAKTMSRSSAPPVQPESLRTLARARFNRERHCTRFRKRTVAIRLVHSRSEILVKDASADPDASRPDQVHEVLKC